MQIRKQTKPLTISFQKKIFSFFIVVAILILSIFLVYRSINNRYRADKDLVRYSENILAETDTIIALEKDLVIRTRGYVITGYKENLLPIPSLRADIDAQLATLNSLPGEDRLLKQKFNRIATLIQSYFEVSNNIISLRSRPDFQLANEIPLIKASDEINLQLNNLIMEVRQNEISTLASRRSDYSMILMRSSLALRLLIIFLVLSVIGAFLLVYRNAIKRNKVERALRKSEGLVKAIIDHAPVFINVKDRFGKFILANEQFAAVLDKRVEDLLGRYPHEFLPDDISKILSDQDEEVKRTGQITEMQLNIPSSGGTQSFIASKFPLYDDKGRMYALGSAYFDITDIINAHKSLELAYERQQKILNGLQKVLSASSDLLAVVNEKGEFVMLSDTSIELFGYMPKEMMSKNFIDFVAEADKERSLKIAQEIINGRSLKEFTNQIRKKDGTLMPLIWSSEWVAEDGMMYCIARNATEKVRTEKELLQSQERLAHAQELARLGSWDWEVENNVWTCSDEFYKLLGVSRDYSGNMQEYFLNAIHPEEKPLMNTKRNELLSKGTPLDVEQRIVMPDKTIRHFQIKVEAIVKNNKVSHVSGTILDITVRKLNELKLKELNEMLAKRASQLKESNAQLERFAYIASHDLQEPLRMVTSFLGLLENRISNNLDDTSKTYMHFAVDGADRMKALINDLLEYSRIDTEKLHYSKVDLNETIQNVLQIFSTLLKDSGGEVHYPSLPVVTGNKVQLNQLFQNLIGNSLKYHGDNKPLIEIGFEETEYEWKFFVKDNGIGIDSKFHEKIFVIFQRLHSRDKFSGTGIGLAISKKIVEHHGGRIWVKSESGQGSTFYFTIKKPANE